MWLLNIHYPWVSWNLYLNVFKSCPWLTSCNCLLLYDQNTSKHVTNYFLTIHLYYLCPRLSVPYNFNPYYMIHIWRGTRDYFALSRHDLFNRQIYAKHSQEHGSRIRLAVARATVLYLLYNTTWVRLLYSVGYSWQCLVNWPRLQWESGLIRIIMSDWEIIWQILTSWWPLWYVCHLSRKQYMIFLKYLLKVWKFMDIK